MKFIIVVSQWELARIFSLGHYLFLEAHSFLVPRSRKTVSFKGFEEQITFADKYPSIFRAKWRLLSLYFYLILVRD